MKIVLVGGGTAGHVIPNLVLLPDLLSEGWEVHYIGSDGGIESTLTPKDKVIYHAIPAGKLRRYFDLRNVTDIFKTAAGYFKSVSILRSVRPDVAFLKGGFVCVPVALAASSLGIPFAIHESDRTPGLANRICMPLARRVLTAFPGTAATLPARSRSKCVCAGEPVRPELLNGDRETGLRLCGFDGTKPVALIMGGSLGSVNLNALLRRALPDLTLTFDIIHACGRGKTEPSLDNIRGYKQLEYIGEELAHLYKACDVAAARAGSNTVFELFALRIPSVLVPLPLSASRGDQIMNAREFAQTGSALAIYETDGGLRLKEGETPATAESLVLALKRAYESRNEMVLAMDAASARGGAQSGVQSGAKSEEPSGRIVDPVDSKNIILRELRALIQK